MNDFILSSTRRLETISNKIANYINAGLYVADIDASEEHNLDTLFPILLSMCIQDLQEMGLAFHVDLQDIYEDSRKISALISLREILDKEHLLQGLKVRYDLKERLEAILDSVDYTVSELLYTVMDLLTHECIGNVKSLEETYLLEGEITSTSTFKKHIQGILDQIVPLSTTSDAALQAYSVVVPALVEIKKDLSSLDKLFLMHGLFTHEDVAAQEAFIPHYTRLLADPKYAEGYAYLLSLPLEYSTWSKQQVTRWMEIIKFHRHNTPGYFQYYKYQSVIKRVDAFFAIKLGLLAKLSWSHEGMFKYRWLLVQDGTPHAENDYLVSENYISIIKKLDPEDKQLPHICQAMVELGYNV